MSKAKLCFIAAVTAVFAFASCNKNNNSDENEPAEVTADVTYFFNGGGDLLALFDITATYADASGQEKQNAIGSLPWKKEIKNIKVPFTAKLSITYIPKTEYVEKDTYVVGRGYGIIYSTSDGQVYGTDSFTTLTIGKDKITEYQDYISGVSDVDEKNIEAND